MLYLLVGLGAFVLLWLFVRAIRRSRAGEASIVMKPYLELRADDIAEALSHEGEWYEPERSVAGDLRATATSLEQDLLVNPSPGDRDAWERAVYPVFERAVESVRDERERRQGDGSAIDSMSTERRSLLVVHAIYHSVNGGGFDSFFLSEKGDYAWAGPGCAQNLGLNDLAAVLDEANSVFPNGPPPHRGERLRVMEELGVAAFEKWSAMNTSFFAADQSTFGTMIRFVCDNFGSFYRVG